MHSHAASCEELRARTGKPPIYSHTGKLSVVSATFLVLKCILKCFNFSRLAHHTSATSQPETLPYKRDNVSPYEQNKIIFNIEREFVLAIFFAEELNLVATLVLLLATNYLVNSQGKNWCPVSVYMY